MDTKTLCLGVLAHGDASGYEIKKAFEDEALGHIQDAGFSSIYPALSRLLKAGHVTVTAETQAGKPDKKVYSLTPAGRLAFLDALATPSKFDQLRSDFLFKMLFAELMPARQLEAALDAHVAEIRGRLERMAGDDCGHVGVGPQFVHGFGLAMYRAADAYIEEHKYELLRAALMSEQPAEAAE